MRKLAGLLMVLAGSAPAAFAIAAVPEIDPGGAVNAVALIAGILLVLRSTRKK